MEVLLELQEVSINFGGHTAVDHVSLKINKNEFTSIAGPNGAGKTTLFNLISGQLQPTTGKIFYKGMNITNLPPYKRTRLGLGRSFQITNVFPNLTVLENVRLAVQAKENVGYKLLASKILDNRLEEKAMSWLELVNLEHKFNNLAVTLTHGEKRKLEIAIILALESELLLLDEPTAGMSIEEVPVILELIKNINKERHRTILLIEHKMDMLMNLSEKLVILNQGKLIAEGNPEKIMGDKLVQSAYLGGYNEQLA